jgi:hypothetical protein
MKINNWVEAETVQKEDAPGQSIFGIIINKTPLMIQTFSKSKEVICEGEFEVGDLIKIREYTDIKQKIYVKKHSKVSILYRMNGSISEVDFEEAERNHIILKKLIQLAMELRVINFNIK